MTEGADHRDGRLVAQPVKYHIEFLPRLGILLAPEPDRRLTDIFDQVNRGLSLLLAQGIPEHAPQEANILTERIILYRPVLVLIVDVIFIESCISGSKESHNKRSLARHAPPDAKLASVQAGICHAKIDIRSNSVNFSTS
jgi:hypothetical protein